MVIIVRYIKMVVRPSREKCWDLKLGDQLPMKQSLNRISITV